jgi:exonuclease III
MNLIEVGCLKFWADLHSLVPMAKLRDFKILHWNCNSISNKASEFKDFLFREKPSIVSLNETKLDYELANYNLRFNGYLSVFKNRNTHGGGVALIKKEDIEF